MRRILRAALSVSCLLLGAWGQAEAESIFVLGFQNRLLSFDSASPDNLQTQSVITGIQPGESIIGIDFRPSTGQLYAVSTANIYTVNPATGAATLVSALSAPLGGGGHGVAFNPVTEQLQVTDAFVQSFRVNVDTGQVSLDPLLRYADGDINAGEPPTLTGLAFSNDFNGASSTAFYGIDGVLGVLAVQSPFSISTVNTVGLLGTDTSGNAGVIGFDISGLTGIAYAALTAAGGPDGFSNFDQLYTINLNTGLATPVGRIGNLRFGIIGLTAPGSVAPVIVPEPATVVLLGAGLAGYFIKSRRRCRALSHTAKTHF